MMNMKKLLLFLVGLSVFCRLIAQTESGENEQHDSYVQCVYIDNLDHHLISDILINSYYYKLKPSDFKISQIIDTNHNRRELHIHTKKAKSGFLYVNQYIMESIEVSSPKSERMKVVYVYNDSEVKTYKDVIHLLGLRKKRIGVSKLTQDEQLGIITVFITKE